jgi:sulfur relay (sulfurtransferase) DsrC/TusE family protein
MSKTKSIQASEEMIELIEFVKQRFIEEYQFEPSVVDVTKAIAKRVKDYKLFEKGSIIIK